MHFRSSDNRGFPHDDFKSPDGLADRISEILECPVTIEDSNHRLISYSKHESNVDEARVATIIRRKVPEDVINGLWQSGVMAKLFDSDEPVIIPPIESVGLGNRIAVSVRKNQVILGFIWAQTNEKTVDENTIQILKEAAQLAQNYLLRHQQKQRNSEESYKEFFWQLLSGNVRNKTDIERQAKRFGMELQGDLSVVLIEFDGEVTKTMERHAYYLTETLKQARVIFRLFDQNQLIILAQLGTEKDSINDFTADFIDKMKERLHVKAIIGAYGLIYDSPEHITDSYKQALKVLELKEQFPERLQDVYNYHDLGVFQFIHEFYKFRSRNYYHNPSLKKLKAYDQEHRSDLLASLKMFLECDGNVHKASRLLHIHINTLNYRLKRIAEIANIDLRNYNQKMTLYLDLLVNEMNQRNL
ncbi:PucR family transcriptional regulator [Virgibacillus siamensis]|uniref:PucR family transcriptional regulator n=1 Tax=Virgibacillus siamensis TaxID=480071 RepID=UPI000986D326|nr:helix-turn-helix domain-containing protein [Virgibacillus siamensis]